MTSSAAAENHQRRSSGGGDASTSATLEHQQLQQQMRLTADRHQPEVVAMEEKFIEMTSSSNGATVAAGGAAGTAGSASCGVGGIVVAGLPEVDLSHLSEAERQQIATVMARAYGLDDVTMENLADVPAVKR